MTIQEALKQASVEADLMSPSLSNRPGTALRPTFITVHNTANPRAGADARMHAQYIRGPEARAAKKSWHYTVDDKRCVQHIPVNEVAWHSKGGANQQSIGIEVCENQGIDQNAAIHKACLLTAALMADLNITDVTHVVPHSHWQKKDCPRVILHRFPGGFKRFREVVEEYRAQITTADDATPSLHMLDLNQGDSPAEGTESSEQMEAAIDDSDLDCSTIAFKTEDDLLRDRIARLERLLGQKELRIAELEESLGISSTLTVVKEP